MGSRLALGTVQFGRDYGIANNIGQVSASSARDIVAFAKQSDIDTLDTAIAYGDSEVVLGEIGVGQFKVVSKIPPVGVLRRLPPSWIADQLADSLSRLRINSLHGLLLHRPADLFGSCGEELRRQLLAQRDSGLVHKIGVSIYDPCEIEPILSALSVDLVQAPMNVFDRRLANSGWLARMHRAGIEVHVRSVFLQGLLLMPESQVPTQFTHWFPLLAQWRNHLKVSQQLPLHAALAHVLAYDEIGKIVVGCDSLSQLQQIVSASQTRPLRAPNVLDCDDTKLINPAEWAPR